MNLIGKMLGDRYEILEKIGNGGMATVYKAKCHILNRYVAVKILRDEFTTDTEFIKRFNSEAQSAASLTHPNIVSIYDVGNEGSLYYIVMELIQGKTLKEIIIEDKVLTWKWSLNIAIQIASALETAHRNSIIHRDIKPHNIIITEDGIAKVTDFGIAKAVSNSTITAFGTTIGSVHYFSPEHAKGGITDAKSDIYSLGVVLYEMLTGRVPFDADTPVSVALKQLQEEPVEPKTINPSIPVSINKIILKAMQKDPNLRYKSASDMLDDLSRALKTPDEDFVMMGNFTDVTQRIPSLYTNHDENRGAKIEKEENDKDNKEEKKPGKLKQFFKKHPAFKVLIILLIAIIIFVAAMGGTIFVLNSSRPKQEQIPNLSGQNNEKALTKDEAIKKLEELGFKYEVSEEYSDEVEEGCVISQEPPYQDNYRINISDTIKIIVSKGQKKVTLPKKMVGKKLEDLKEELDELEVKYEVKEENNDKIEAGIVIAVEPDSEGEEISLSTTVIITSSLGVKEVKVPNVVGKTFDEAKAELEKLGLTVEKTEVEDKTKEDGKITEQSQKADSSVKEGTKITLKVNKLPEIVKGTVEVNVKSLRGYEVKMDEETGEPIEAQDVKLRVTVDDKDVSEAIKVKESSTSEKFEIEGSGKVTVKVFINDVKVQEKEFNLASNKVLKID